MAASASTMSLKLLVDKKTRKVVFAEADKAFVDFLFHLMSLPLGTVIKLVTHESMVGSLGNLYGSIQNINDTYLQPGLDKDVFLNPKVLIPSPNNVPLLIDFDGSSETKNYYLCYNCYNNRTGHSNMGYISDDPKTICPHCRGCITRAARYVAPVKAADSSKGGGFVKGVVTYMVTDDLKVMAHSTISTITVLNDFNIKDFGALEVKDVHLGVDEGLKVLEAALHTDSVLTTVFLGK